MLSMQQPMPQVDVTANSESDWSAPLLDKLAPANVRRANVRRAMLQQGATLLESTLPSDLECLTDADLADIVRILKVAMKTRVPMSPTDSESTGSPLSSATSSGDSSPPTSPLPTLRLAALSSTIWSAATGAQRGSEGGDVGGWGVRVCDSPPATEPRVGNGGRQKQQPKKQPVGTPKGGGTCLLMTRLTASPVTVVVPSPELNAPEMNAPTGLALLRSPTAAPTANLIVVDDEYNTSKDSARPEEASSHSDTDHTNTNTTATHADINVKPNSMRCANDRDAADAPVVSIGLNDAGPVKSGSESATTETKASLTVNAKVQNQPLSPTTIGMPTSTVSATTSAQGEAEVTPCVAVSLPKDVLGSAPTASVDLTIPKVVPVNVSVSVASGVTTGVSCPSAGPSVSTVFVQTPVADRLKTFTPRRDAPSRAKYTQEEVDHNHLTQWCRNGKGCSEWKLGAGPCPRIHCVVDAQQQAFYNRQIAAKVHNAHLLGHAMCRHHLIGDKTRCHPEECKYRHYTWVQDLSPLQLAAAEKPRKKKHQPNYFTYGYPNGGYGQPLQQPLQHGGGRWVPVASPSATHRPMYFGGGGGC